MIDTHPFSHNVIYENFKDFFIVNRLEKREFKLERPSLVYEDRVSCQRTGKVFSVFGIEKSHRLAKDFNSYIYENFHFESQLGKLVDNYEKTFNRAQLECYYSVFFYYFINISGEFESLYVYDFEQVNVNCMFMVETKDSNIESFEQELLEYYINCLNIEFPSELIKPISKMTNAELDLVRMICI